MRAAAAACRSLFPHFTCQATSCAFIRGLTGIVLPITDLRQVVELSVLGPCEERGDLGTSVNQCRSGGVTRVADSDCTVGQWRHLDTRATWITALALSPGHCEPVGGYPVFCEHPTISID